MILACDGADSAFLKSFKRYSDFTFSSVFSGWIYVEITIPPADDKANAWINKNALHYWPRTDKNVHITGVPNPDGSVNAILHMKLHGDQSYEYFKDNYEEFEKYFLEVHPDFKRYRANLKKDFERFAPAKFYTNSCFPWYKGNILLLGDASHVTNPFLGSGLNIDIEECQILDDLLTKHNG